MKALDKLKVHLKNRLIDLRKAKDEGRKRVTIYF